MDKDKLRKMFAEELYKAHGGMPAELEMYLKDLFSFAREFWEDRLERAKRSEFHRLNSLYCISELSKINRLIDGLEEKKGFFFDDIPEYQKELLDEYVSIIDMLKKYPMLIAVAGGEIEANQP